MTREQLTARVTELMGQSPFRADGSADVSIVGSVARREGAYVAELRAQRESGALLGSRELVGTSDCHALDASIALVVTLLIDEAASSTPEERGRSVRMGVAGVLQTGVLPRVAEGIAALAGARVGVPLLFTGALYPAQTERDPRGRGAHTRAWYLGVAACPAVHEWPNRARIEACGGADLGALHARPRGLADASASTKLWAQLRAELALQWPLWRSIAVRGAAGMAVALARPSFRYASAASDVDVHTVSRASASAQLSFIIELR